MTRDCRVIVAATGTVGGATRAIRRVSRSDVPADDRCARVSGYCRPAQTPGLAGSRSTAAMLRLANGPGYPRRAPVPTAIYAIESATGLPALAAEVRDAIGQAVRRTRSEGKDETGTGTTTGEPARSGRRHADVAGESPTSSRGGRIIGRRRHRPRSRQRPLARRHQGRRPPDGASCLLLGARRRARIRLHHGGAMSLRRPAPRPSRRHRRQHWRRHYLHRGECCRRDRRQLQVERAGHRHRSEHLRSAIGAAERRRYMAVVIVNESNGAVTTNSRWQSSGQNPHLIQQGVAGPRSTCPQASIRDHLRLERSMKTAFPDTRPLPRASPATPATGGNRSHDLGACIREAPRSHPWENIGPPGTRRPV